MDDQLLHGTGWLSESTGVGICIADYSSGHHTHFLVPVEHARHRLTANLNRPYPSMSLFS